MSKPWGLNGRGSTIRYAELVGVIDHDGVSESVTTCDSEMSRGKSCLHQLPGCMARTLLCVCVTQAQGGRTLLNLC
jgi:hypothetical protein